MKSWAALLWFVFAAPALAHPLGNSSVNRWAALDLGAHELTVDYVLEMAELPTLLQSAAADIDGDGEVSVAEWSAHAQRWLRELSGQISLRAGAKALSLRPGNARWSLREAEAGLQVLRLEGRLHAQLPEDASGGGITLDYEDRSEAFAPGWQELLLRADPGARVAWSGLPRQDRSARLTRLDAADVPRLLHGSLRLRPGAIAAQASPAVRAATPASVLAPPPAARAEREAVLAPSAVPAGAPAAAPAAAPHDHFLSRYFHLGMYHIATGWDHLLFLLGLLLLRLPLRQTVAVVSAFTVAHSLSLASAALGWVSPPGTWVEPAIALSIAYVGLLNLLGRGRRHGVILAFGFGLVHGFGFAGALAMPSGGQSLGGLNLVLSLLAFNLGIETFQVGLVLLIVPLLALGARSGWYLRANRFAAVSLTLAGLGVFLSRSIGGLI